MTFEFMWTEQSKLRLAHRIERWNHDTHTCAGGFRGAGHDDSWERATLIHAGSAQPVLMVSSSEP